MTGWNSERRRDPSAQVDVFELVSDPSRVAIVRALGEHQRQSPRSESLRFSELQTKAGIADKGNFNYHLDRLVGRLVRKENGRYALSPQGHRLYAALAAREYDLDLTWGAEPIQGNCSWCGGPLDEAAYRDGQLWIECVRGHRSTSSIPATLLEERPDGSWQERVAVWDARRFDLLREGLCDTCGGRMEPEVVREGGRVLYEGTCKRCGGRVSSSIGMAVACHPLVIEFFQERGQDLLRTPAWQCDFCQIPVSTVVSEDPLRVHLDVECAGEVLRLTLDERAHIVGSELAAD